MRHSGRRLAAVGTVFLIAATALVVGAPVAGAATTIPKAGNGARIELTMRTAVERLPVAAENRFGYERSKFKHWNDVDRDCQNTRAEVLRAESTARTNSGCSVSYGRWFSSYDGVTLSYASQIDIDHFVPLAEAWDSGARRWTAGKRQAFANDLADGRSLIAVSSSSNRAKGDKDPVDWLPARNVCHYLKQWVAVKTRWGLSVDPAEKRFLYSASFTCPRTVIVVSKATVTTVVVGSGSASSPGGSTGGTSTGSGGTDPRFGTCADAKAAGYGPYVAGVDPEYSWYTDRDNDGVVCE